MNNDAVQHELAKKDEQIAELLAQLDEAKQSSWMWGMISLAMAACSVFQAAVIAIWLLRS